MVMSHSEEETIEIGEQIGKKLKRGDVIALYGGFGVGKTVLIKGIAKGIKCKEKVKSPSFNYVHKYTGRLPIYHIDLYKVRTTQDILTLGIHEFIDSDEVRPQGVCVIEWAEKAENILPNNTMKITIEIVDENTRKIECRC